MPQATTTSLNVDLTRIENAEVRRAVRQLIQQLQEIISQQQIEIEALLEMMLNKNLSSLSEFRRHVQRIAQRSTERNERVHTQLERTMRDRQSNLEAPPQKDHADEPERQVYKL